MTITDDLFSQSRQPKNRETLLPAVILLPAFAMNQADAIWQAIADVSTKSPLRHMRTPGGHQMSAAMTNCGQIGWCSDQHGYRYSQTDPQTGRHWPAMPEILQTLATDAAAEAGYPGFYPDVCLINRYRVGARMGLHQDRDEQDFSQPIVSVSLGLPVIFQFGGPRRGDPRKRILLEHGDVIVWGGDKRCHYHGVLSLRDGRHPLTGRYRYNLTFRKAC